MSKDKGNKSKKKAPAMTKKEKKAAKRAAKRKSNIETTE